MLGLGNILTKGGAVLGFPNKYSFNFDGSNDYLETADNESFDFGTGDFSISFWFNVNDIDWNWAVSRANSANSADLYRAGTNNSGKIIFRDIAGGTDIVGSTTVSINTWYHFQATRNSGTLKLYLNGSEDASGSSGGNFNSDKGFRVGRWRSSGDYWNGQLTNVAVWSRALAEEEVQSIMNKSYSQLKGVEKTSLVAWYALDDVQKTTDNSVSSGLIESETGEILSSDVSSFDSITGTGNNYTNNILEYVADGYAFFNVSGYAQGKLYRFTYTVLTQTGSGMAHSGGSSIFTGGIPTTVGSHEQYLVAGSQNLLIMRSTGFRGTITDIVLQEVSNTGVVTGATTTTSVYGGNAPILPRAVDVAKEGQADAIGNGSALFNGSTDYIDLGDTDLFSFGNGTVDQPLSITLWANLDSDTQNMLLSKGVYNNNGEYVLWSNSSNKLSFELYNGSTYELAHTTSTITSYENEWIHIGVTYNGVGGSSANAGIKIYINGVSQALTLGDSGSYTSMPNTTSNLHIGNYNSLQYKADGELSQLGIWKGELTQAQVQSVMESTSYSKIPSSVKSTLGAERVLNSDFSDGENIWNLNNANVVNEVLEVDEGAFSYYAQQAVDGSGSNYRQFESGYLMKVEIVVDEYTSGGTIIYATGNNIGTFNSAGTHTIYYKPSANEYVRLRSDGGGFEGKISSVSIKRVSNDLVAYYPLDGDSSRANGTDDVTTGEVLGDELVDTTTYTGGSNGSEFYIRNSNVPTLGGIYKLTFDVDSYSSGSFYFTTNTGSNPRVEPSVYSTTNSSIGSQDGSETYYLKINVGGGFKFKASGTYSANVSNISLKEITSNTGVLY